MKKTVECKIASPTRPLTYPSARFTFFLCPRVYSFHSTHKQEIWLLSPIYMEHSLGWLHHNHGYAFMNIFFRECYFFRYHLISKQLNCAQLLYVHYKEIALFLDWRKLKLVLLLIKKSQRHFLVHIWTVFFKFLMVTIMIVVMECVL